MSRFGHYPSNMAELHNCWLAWNQTDKVLRFGQYMINNYAVPNTVWPDLFYTENPFEAYDICAEELGFNYEEK